MTETSRDDEHDEDAMVHHQKTSLTRGVVIVVFIRRLAQRADRRRQPRQGKAGRIRHGRNDHGQGKDAGEDGTGDTSMMTMPAHTTTRGQ
jgi:hypothetical protein